MAPTWMQIEIILHEGRGETLDPPPGRILLAGGTHTFEELSRAIDVSFGRWDLSHLHVFELPDGSLLGPVDPDEDEAWEDETLVLVSEALKPGDEFGYVFDLGDGWRHSCRVAADLVDPRIEAGEVPLRPLPIWGWGTLPDQHGRVRPDG